MDTRRTLICLLKNPRVCQTMKYLSLNDFPTQCGIHFNNRQKYQNVNKSVSLSPLKSMPKIAEKQHQKKHNKEGLKPQRNHNAFCCQ